MHITKLKVKPRKKVQAQPCAVELSAMLACWASSGDLGSTGACREAAKSLQMCMTQPTIKGRAHKSNINYHLTKLQ